MILTNTLKGKTMAQPTTIKTGDHISPTIHHDKYIMVLTDNVLIETSDTTLSSIMVRGIYTSPVKREIERLTARLNYDRSEPVAHMFTKTTQKENTKCLTS